MKAGSGIQGWFRIWKSFSMLLPILHIRLGGTGKHQNELTSIFSNSPSQLLSIQGLLQSSFLSEIWFRLHCDIGYWKFIQKLYQILTQGSPMMIRLQVEPLFERRNGLWNKEQKLATAGSRFLELYLCCLSWEATHTLFEMKIRKIRNIYVDWVAAVASFCSFFIHSFFFWIMGVIGGKVIIHTAVAPATIDWG